MIVGELLLNNSSWSLIYIVKFRWNYTFGFCILHRFQIWTRFFVNLWNNKKCYFTTILWFLYQNFQTYTKELYFLECEEIKSTRISFKFSRHSLAYHDHFQLFQGSFSVKFSNILYHWIAKIYIVYLVISALNRKKPQF